MSESGTRVNAQRYYGEYHGHKVGHLKIVHDKMRAGEKDSIVFLAGDSSLDNKYWFDDTVSAIEPYSKVEVRPHEGIDVSFQLLLHPNSL